MSITIELVSKSMKVCITLCDKYSHRIPLIPYNPFLAPITEKVSLPVLCIFSFRHQYKICLMEDVSLANRRGRREGDKPEGKERSGKKL